MAERRRRARSGRRLGKQPPRHRFFLNPYIDFRFTNCPQCSRKTRVRKLPLIIHIDPMQLIALNKTCRYCPTCDLLIVHRDQIEDFLGAFLGRADLETLRDEYLVVGTIDRAQWQRGARTAVSLQEMLDNLHDFTDFVQFELAPPYGWGPDPKSQGTR